MSLPITLDITCPQCSHPQQFQAWRSVNVTLDPELRDRVLSGSLNLFHCEECGTQAPVDTGLLYHDMERQFMVWVQTEGAEPGELGQVTAELFEQAGTKYRLRTVANPNDLIEKVLLFEDGWDDRIFEIVKVLVANQMGETPVAGLYYEGQETSETGEKTVMLTMLADDGEVQRLGIGWEAGLQQLETALGDWLGAQEAAAGEWLRVDADYAYRRLLEWQEQ